MCSIFAMSKVSQLGVSFKEIIQEYKEINLYNKDIHDQIVAKVESKDKENGNLIDFYNRGFIQNLKEFICKFKHNGYIFT